MKSIFTALFMGLCLITLKAQNEPINLAQGPAYELGEGWYYNGVMKSIYPVDSDIWVYSYAFGGFIALYYDAEADVYFFWDPDYGWAVTADTFNDWIYIYDSIEGSENIDSGWYYSYGLASEGNYPSNFYSYDLQANTMSKLTIEIVNDTVNATNPDLRKTMDEIYLTAYSTGNSNYSSSQIVANTSVALSKLGSGNSVSFTTTEIDSGRLFFSYDMKYKQDGADKTISGVLPTSQADINPLLTFVTRNDKVEIDYSITKGVADGDANITAVDYYSIPIKIETIDANGNVLQTFSPYQNTSKIIEDIVAIGSSTPAPPTESEPYTPTGSSGSTTKALSINDAVYYLDPSTGTYTTDPTTQDKQFLYVISPQTWSGTSSNDNNWLGFNPYPTMDTYLKSVSGQSVTIEGNFNGIKATNPTPGNEWSVPPAVYKYTATLNTDPTTGTPNPVTTLSGTLTALPGQPSPGTAENITITYNQLLQGIYSTAPDISVGGATAAPAGNTAYGAIIRDFLAGFAAGYIGQQNIQPSPNLSSDKWWSLPPFQLTGGDSYFNTYAKVLSEDSGTYAFAYSDRLRPELAGLGGSVSKLRITILPDDFLPAPSDFTASATATDGEIKLTWDEVDGATGYDITWTYGGTPGTKTVTGYPQGGVTLTGLTGGAPYSFNITSKNANGESPVASIAKGTPKGTFPVVSGDTYWHLILNFDAALVTGGDKVTINGLEADISVTGSGATATATATFKTNILPVVADWSVVSNTDIQGLTSSGIYTADSPQPTVTLSGGGGTGGAVTLNSLFKQQVPGTPAGNDFWTILSIDSVTPGFGYTSMPTITVSGGTTSGTVQGPGSTTYSGKQAELQVSGGLTSTTPGYFPIAAKKGAQNQYLLTWTNDKGVVFEGVFFVTLTDDTTGTDSLGLTTGTVTPGPTDTYLYGNLNTPTFTGDFTLSLDVQPEPGTE